MQHFINRIEVVLGNMMTRKAGLVNQRTRSDRLGQSLACVDVEWAVQLANSSNSV